MSTSSKQATELSSIHWPAIPEMASFDQVQASEPAFVVHADGRREQGTLKSFDPAAEALEFIDARKNARDLRFEDLRELRLTRPVRRNASAAFTPALREGIEVPPQSHPYRIDLVQGEALTGDALGWIRTEAGVFLAVPAYGDAAIRVFVPRSAIRAQSIGRRLGEALVNGQAVSEANLRLALAEQARLQTQRLGEVLTENAVITREQLHAALARQTSMPMVKLGEALVELKLISPAQLDEALQRQNTQRNKPLGKILCELGLITEADLARAVSQKLRIPFVDLNRFKVEPDAIRAIPAELARELQAMPLCRDGGSLIIAME